jgi:hypothetical protein
MPWNVLSGFPISDIGFLITRASENWFSVRTTGWSIRCEGRKLSFLGSYMLARTSSELGEPDLDLD